MTAKHTPGPWRILPEECDKPYIRIRGDNLGMRYKVANVLTPIYDGVNEREAAETRANAKLISASPDLLEAAIHCLAFIRSNPDSPMTASEVLLDRAITKATK